MKKLLLVPVVVLTGFLAFAFLMPATAATVVRSVAPVAHLSLPAVLSAGSQAAPAASTGPAGSSSLPGGSASAASRSSQGSSTIPQGSTSQPLISIHEVATAGEENCGRFGNGFHGGKHDFTCPNRPFPAPAS